MQWRQSAKRLVSLAALTALIISSLSIVLARAVDNTSNLPAWVAPSAVTMKLVGPANAVSDQPNFQSNLDCTELGYRLVGSTTPQTGCFMGTAYGLVDPDNDVVIFNGTDEALPLLPFSAHDVLTPWPKTVDSLILDAANTGGSFISLYTNIEAKLQDQRNTFAQLTAKKITGPPDLRLTDPTGNPLVINAQTMAFSDSGSWLVVETLGGSFVRINLATLDMTAFAPAFGSQGSPALLKSQVAVSDDGRFVAIQNAAATSFKVYDLATCSGISADLQPLSCQSHEYYSFINDQLSGLQSIAHVRFINDGLLSLRALDSTGDNTYELAPAASINSLIDYLGLGDSYTSGEGAFDYQTGTDTADDMCHLSANSYPVLLTRDLFASGGHSVACSGAVIHDVLPSNPNSYPGQVANGVARSKRGADQIAQLLADFNPGYLPQADFVSHYQPGILTVSVGGDDVGFGDLIQNCVEPHISLHLSDSVCYDTYEDRLELKNLIDRTVPRWTALYKQLLAKAPNAHLYAIGYPQITSDTGDCALNVHLSKGELEFAAELVDYLNGAIEQAASAAGVSYVDISQALAGHRLCETASYDVAVNGLTAGSDGGPFGLKIFGKESYHPNALGQALIEQAILKQTHNLQNSEPATTVTGDNPSQTLLNVPKTGRTINTLVPDDELVNQSVVRGTNLSLNANGANDGLLPDSSYTITLDGPAGTMLATAISDDGGNINVQVTVPANTVPGGHTIDITGQNQAGEPIDVTQPIYAAASNTDSDGDGTTNTADSCPSAANSGVDADADGIDDACDSFIGLPSNSGTTGGTSTGNDSSPGSNAQGVASDSSDDGANVVTVIDAETTTDSNGLGDPLSPDLVASLATNSGFTSFVSGNSSTIASVLGAHTTNPNNVGPQAFRKTPGSTSTSRQREPTPRASHWRLWLGIITIAWLVLLIICWYLNRSFKRQAVYTFRDGWGEFG